MTVRLFVDAAGPLMSVQDLGRPGRIDVGLSRGGAMDRTALLAAAALLGGGVRAGIEMAGMGGTFRVDAPLRFALTGAVMRASVDGQALRWNASHMLLPGQVLVIGAVRAGSYGYLVPAGAVLGRDVLGSAAAHLSAGLGGRLQAGDVVQIGAAGAGVGQVLPDRDDLEGGTLRLMPGPQTQMFSAAEQARFAQTVFHRSPQANRTALPLMKDGAGFAALGGNPVSDFIAPGDVQITGDGTPVVMMAECQTVGGYPRIGTVIAADLARAAQAPVGAALRFEWVDVGRADALFVPEAQQLTALKAAVRPLVRDPRDMHDLLSYQLISGVTAGRDMEPLP